MVCFTIVLLLVLVLGNTFGYVSADGDTSSILFMNQPDYVSSSVYDSTNFFQGYIGLKDDTSTSAVFSPLKILDQSAFIITLLVRDALLIWVSLFKPI